MGRNGAVGANHPLATQAGLDTLRAGGNAVDASVAISLTLGVVEPGMSGLGGDGFYQVYTAQRRDIALLQRHRRGTARRHTRALPRRRHRGTRPAQRLHARPARRPRRDACRTRQAAVAATVRPRDRACARRLSPSRTTIGNFAGDVRAVLAADARSRAVFLAGLDIGVPPLAALIRQPDLARTLEEIAQDGAETFYRGRLAKRLAAGMREAGVLVDERDLDAYQPQTAGSDRHRLSRLPRHADAAEFHRLHHAADAEDRRALRPCRARSGAAHPRAGGGEEARLPRSRTLRHRSALRRRAAGSVAVGRLRR